MKIITRTCLAALFLFSFNLLGQEDDPCGDAEYPVDPPGEDGGCIDYADCNDNGTYDLGEPCFDGDPGEGGYTEDDEGDYQEYGDHTVENCIAMTEGRETYWIGEDEFATWDDPNVDCGYLLEEIGFMPHPGPPPFDEIDADGNGEVDMEEARAWFQANDPEHDDDEFEQRFNEVDMNDDGVVDQSEHDAAVMEGEEDHHDEGDMTPVMHILEDIHNSVQHLDEGLQNDIMQLAADLEDAAHAEHSEEGCDGCAGDVLEGAEGLVGNLSPEDADHLGNLLFALECETHMEHDENHDCGSPPGSEDEEGEEGEEGELGSSEGDEGSTFWCAICDVGFDTEEEMDQHAAEMGHVETDYDHEDEGDDDHDYDEDDDEDDDDEAEDDENVEDDDDD